MGFEMMDEFRSRKFWGKLGRRLAVAALLLLCLGGGKTTASASGNDFSIKADLLQGGDGSTYDIKVTVQNSGADWEGTVRLTIEDRYYLPCAYDTELSLPAGSKKQFTIKIPVNSLEDTRGMTHIVLLDKNGKETVSKNFKGLLSGKTDALLMGILSDDFSGLTYLDMGGQELYFFSDFYPVKLVELNQDNLAEHLDSLIYLVIDHYSTEVLTDEQMESLWSWNENGGILIVGTGAYAEDTLGGFDSDILGVESLGVYPPGAHRPPNVIGGNVNNSMYYGLENRVNVNQLTIADLKTTLQDYQTVFYSGGYVRSAGDGAVSVLPYSLSELGTLNTDAYGGMKRADYLSYMLDEISIYSQLRNAGMSRYYDVEYQRKRLFGMLGNNSTDLNFGILRVIVVLYVIFVGPVLYLILRLLKKRELYWAAVPVSALLGIVLVYMAGRGFEVKDTRVLSVTLEPLAGAGGKQTYMQCFDAGHDEWQLRLSGDYEYVGPLNVSYYYGNDGYYNHIRRVGNDLYFGINPTSPFENCVFYAGAMEGPQRQGSVGLQDIKGHKYGISQYELTGTVVNNSGKDFKCFALVVDNVMYVYGSLPAGQSREMADQPLIYVGAPNYEDYGDYVNELRRFNEADRYKEEMDALAALGIGICGAAEKAVKADVFFMGVTENYERAVDDVCSETSFGCLYIVQ